MLGVCKAAAFLEGPGLAPLVVSVKMKSLGPGGPLLGLNLSFTSCVILSKLYKNYGLCLCFFVSKMRMVIAPTS